MEKERAESLLHVFNYTFHVYQYFSSFPFVAIFLDRNFSQSVMVRGAQLRCTGLLQISQRHRTGTERKIGAFIIERRQLQLTEGVDLKLILAICILDLLWLQKMLFRENLKLIPIE